MPESSTLLSPPFRLAEVLSKFDAAKEKIALIREQSDVLLEILDSASSRSDEKAYEVSLLAAEEKVKEALQQLHAVGKKIESYGVFGNRSNIDARDRITQPLPLNSLVFPDGMTLKYAWSNLMTNRSLASAAEHSNNAFKSFFKARSKAFSGLKRPYSQILDRKIIKNVAPCGQEKVPHIKVKKENDVEDKSRVNSQTEKLGDEKDANHYGANLIEEFRCQLFEITQAVSAVRPQMNFFLFDLSLKSLSIDTKCSPLKLQKHDEIEDKPKANGAVDSSLKGTNSMKDELTTKAGADDNGNDGLANGADLIQESDKYEIQKFPEIFIVSLPKVMKAVMSLAMVEYPYVKSLAIFGDNESGPHVHAFGLSTNHIFCKLSVHVLDALQYFQTKYPKNSLQPFLIWFGSYVSLFKEKCRLCGKLLVMDTSSRNLYPPLIRPFCESSISKGVEFNNGNFVFSLPKLEDITRNAFHTECFPSWIS